MMWFVIMNKTPEQLIVDILKNEMSLDASRVYVGNQNIKMPTDSELFIIVSMLHEKIIASLNSNFEKIIPPSTDLSFFERQEIVTRVDLQVDILSRNDNARLRRWEVIAALSSIYSLQKQEENDFKIFKIPSSFVNTSHAEGGSNINRFSITIPILGWYRKDKIVKGYDYYDTFIQKVDDEKSIETLKGIIEFTIDKNGVS